MAQTNENPARGRRVEQENSKSEVPASTQKPVTGQPKLEVVPPTAEQLDDDEKEFRALRRDLPGVKGASAAGIVTVGVGKTPGKNEFYRTHPGFRPVMP